MVSFLLPWRREEDDTGAAAAQAIKEPDHPAGRMAVPMMPELHNRNRNRNLDLEGHAI
jgi:hypothetical protein